MRTLRRFSYATLAVLFCLIPLVLFAVALRKGAPIGSLVFLAFVLLCLYVVLYVLYAYGLVAAGSKGPAGRRPEPPAVRSLHAREGLFPPAARNGSSRAVGSLPDHPHTRS